MHEEQEEGTLAQTQLRGRVPRKGEGYRNTESYREAIRKRQVWVEPLFAEAKSWHGMRRFGLRTLKRVNAEAPLNAAGQNVKRLVAFGRRGPQEPVQMAPPAPGVAPNHYYEFHHVREHRKRRLWPQRGLFNTLRPCR